MAKSTSQKPAQFNSNSAISRERPEKANIKKQQITV
jgi:hypothetical protein